MDAIRKIVSVARARRRTLVALALFFVALTVLFVRFQLSFHFRGIFLLKGKGAALLEVKDDLFLGEGNRLLAGIDFGPVKRFVREWRHGKQGPGLYLDWDEEEGQGSVEQRFPDGSVLVTNFSRFIDDFGVESRGLFLGGGIAGASMKEETEFLNETGMAYFDGRRWYHIWCNANEAIRSELAPDRYSYPNEWKFLGSSIVRNGPGKIVLSSTHAVEIDNVPLRMNRYAFFREGWRYFRLSIRITNLGEAPVRYSYLFGDEPWLGDFGSSEGNVGWVEDGLVRTVRRIDTRKHRYAGFWDNGNDLVSPRHDFTGVANFLEWLGPVPPDVAYFSNFAGEDPREEREQIPLASNTRFFGVVWGPRTLPPGGEDAFFLAQGMADAGPAAERPVKPEVNLNAPLD